MNSEHILGKIYELICLSIFALICIASLITFFSFVFIFEFAYADIFIKDFDLKAELVVDGLKYPTGMAFLKDDDFLVIEKDNGTVRRVLDGKMQEAPLIDVNVANKYERGLLGIATSDVEDNSLPDYVFLFFSESNKGMDGDDKCPYVTYCELATNPIGNRIYRYDLVDDSLENPKLILDLPSSHGADHIGGYLSMGPDNNIYIISGDGDSCFDYKCEGHDKPSVIFSHSSNFPEGDPPIGRGGILRIDQEGNPVVDKDGKGVLGDYYPLNLYYAYGLRNGFGLDFDPVTSHLWNTENGPTFGDEINLVAEGFNSGWAKIHGRWPVNENNSHPLGDKGYYYSNFTVLDDSKLVDFDGRGNYSAPEFIWNHTVGVTSIKFLNSERLGDDYENDLFVADYNHNNIYNFNLNEKRTELELDVPLEDNIANNYEELEDVIFASGFGAISDLEVGPDGYLYVVSFTEGTVYRILPHSDI